jgi:hypothetical protein
MPWRSQGPGDFPTLGWLVADQMASFLGRPDAGDDEQAEPFVVTREQQDYLNELYRLDPYTCRRVIHRSVLMRPRGWGKSPFVAGIMIAEAMFDVVPDGWDAKGQPVAKPWSTVRTPYVAIAAVTEDQTRFTWDPLLEMLRNGSAPDEFNCEPMDTFVSLERGHIRQITASPNSAKGNPTIAASLDQTETWLTTNHGVKLAQTLRNNATKRGGLTVETPNAYRLGEGSVAERSLEFWEQIQAGQFGEDARSIFFDIRDTPVVDVEDHDDLIRGLRVAYGDSSKDPRGCVLHDPPCDPGWVDLERIALDFRDTSNDPLVMRADFLNQPAPMVEAVDRVTIFGPFGVWAATGTSQPPESPSAVGLAMTADRKWIGLVGAASVDFVPDDDPEAEPVDRIVVAPIGRYENAADAFAMLKSIQSRTDCRIVCDEKGPAATLIPELEAMDVAVDVKTLGEYSSASADFFDGVTSGTLLHLFNDDLDEQVRAAEWRWINDQRVIGRRNRADVIETELVEAAILAAAATTSVAFEIF